MGPEHELRADGGLSGSSAARRANVEARLNGPRSQHDDLAVRGHAYRARLALGAARGAAPEARLRLIADALTAEFLGEIRATEESDASPAESDVLSVFVRSRVTAGALDEGIPAGAGLDVLEGE